MRKCEIEGCDSPHDSKGLCAKHSAKQRRYGDPLASRRAPGDRYYQEVVLQYEGNDCLIWPFKRNKRGYGRFQRNGKRREAHRVLCEETKGPPPTPKHEAAHSCGKGHLGCVTKRHLSWKTPKENSEDKILHGTSSRGEKNPRAKLTEAQVIEILALKGKGTNGSIAKIFGVSPRTISEIQSGKKWGWLSAAPSASMGETP